MIRGEVQAHCLHDQLQITNLQVHYAIQICAGLCNPLLDFTESKLSSNTVNFKVHSYFMHC